MSEESRFRWSLLALCGAAASLRALVFREELAHNPFAAVPWSDAALYWERAGELAAGRWPETGPFLVAPLYPLLLGGLRALGLGLAGVYALQLALNLASGVLVGLFLAGLLVIAFGVDGPAWMDADFGRYFGLEALGRDPSPASSHAWAWAALLGVSLVHAAALWIGARRRGAGSA